MNKLLVTLIMSFVVLFFAKEAACVEQNSVAGKVSIVIGEVTIARQTAPGQSVQARIGLAVSEGDTVKTAPESRIEIVFDSNYVVRCDEKTVLFIKLSNLSASRLHSPIGKLWLNVKHLAQREGISVSSPTAVAAIRGTVFSVTSDSNVVKYAVYRGAISVTPADTVGLHHDTTLAVETGKELTLVNDFAKYLREQENSFKEYQRQQQENFEKYRKGQQQGADSLLHEQDVYVNKRIEYERSLFRELGPYHFSLVPIDTANVSDWVVWNQKRDAKLGW
jgi:hypothetical protein